MIDIEKPLTEKAANKLAKDLFGPCAYVESVGGTKGVWLANKPGWFARVFSSCHLLATSRASWEEALNLALDRHVSYQSNKALNERNRKMAASILKAQLEKA